MKQALIKTVFLSLMAVGLLENAPAAASAKAPSKASLLPGRDRWPTDGWPTAAPEACEVDTNHLARSLEQLPRVCPELHSLLVVRHGRLIVGRYYGGTQPQDAGNVKSVTKSVLSALTGIALERGYLYLNHGEWNGKPIVPAAWVRASTQQTNSAHYALLWWLDTFKSHPMYFAQGLSGQHIVVVPGLDAVVVTTSFQLPTATYRPVGGNHRRFL